MTASPAGRIPDIQSISAAPSPESAGPALRFQPAAHRDDSTLTAVLTWPHGTPLLADLVEMFAHMGLCVATHELLPGRGSDVDETDVAETDVAETTTVHLFTFCPSSAPWEASTANLVSDTFAAAASGAVEVDGYLRLVATAGLQWHEASLVRALGRYVRQAGLELSESSIIDILAAQPRFVRALVALFRARFTPHLPDRAAPTATAEADLADAVTATATLDEDRLLRGLWSLVSATLRTNWFQDSVRAGGPIAFKIDPSRVSLPATIVPYREIFVHARGVEGSHVRGGPISRGGLRWSDRRDDFRTEVLGLMRTQIVKNSLIVPMGAKGAFVVRGAADPSPEQVRAAYSAFIGALLDVTDNVVDGATVHPDDTVIHDGPDTYLVVAADKGTARFSDLANAISTGRGFWLGDAFASGGATGYDHKEMGITARGAWGSVRRHLAESGLDVDTEPFTVAGIGDMSGDVFGNGMLLSRQIRLVGAFDHRHVFLDPDPDPELSYRERERLSTAGRSSWDDYDRTVLSPGGGVWPRTAKTVPLSPQVRRRLGIDATELPPHEVIKALLRAQVDLLWNGGIGTYVKASTDTHTDAADPANDVVRVNADTLRCKVIGEGGNLGLTQRARVEFALAGGRINADFIDNAAGVATSDREVNLKIALDTAVRAGELLASDRNGLLAAVEDDVARAVLEDCDRQTLAISLAEANASFLLSRHERLIENLEETGGMNRAADVLPSTGELAARRRAGTGLVRPEIAVLLARSKNLVRSELLNSPALDDPAFEDVLRQYFPPLIRAHVGDGLRKHRVAREIVAVVLANELIDRVGPGFIHRLEERSGATTPDIVTAYAAVRTVFDVDRLWRGVLALPDVTRRARLDLLFGVQDLIERATSWLLQVRRAGAGLAADIDRLTPTVTTLAEQLPGLSGRLEHDLETLRVFAAAPALAVAADRTGHHVTRVAQAYREIGVTFGLDWLADAIPAGAPTGYWDTMAADVITDELQEHWHGLVAVVLQDLGTDEPVADAIDRWRAGNPTSATRLADLIADLRRSGRVDAARGCVVNAELALAVRGSVSTGGR
ncbi:NAD-glutamate dehydrogenase domain-containing protein [Rhodococcus sp. ABRD24]|uniref:NAD-glutamate dehydrogenase domain-containing protein n=1 Tax=Rhodococcus sp. ABRD24 TaxID=2507582 RepID=UPI001F6009A6|nr:NAD-glutamate dehydrogenase domain-containing protein [Rhodococcus sp. ABRD24]